MRQHSMNETDSAVNASNKTAAQDLRSLLKKDKLSNSSVTTPTPASEVNETSRKRTRDQVEDEDEDKNDDVRWGQVGWLYS